MCWLEPLYPGISLSRNLRLAIDVVEAVVTFLFCRYRYYCCFVFYFGFGVYIEDVDVVFVFVVSAN